MKLLIVTQAVDRDHANLGFFVRWLEEFAKHCEEVTVIANEVGRYSLPKNVTIYGLGKEYGSARIKRYVKFLALILWFTRSYDAVFCHMNPEFVLAGASWWRLMGKRIGLWYVHGTVSSRLQAAIALVHIAFTTNKESLRIMSPKVRIVGHGIDVDYFVPGTRTPGREKKIVVASRISRSKRPDLIARALARVAAHTPIQVECMGGPMTDDDRVYQKEFEQVIQHMPFFTYVGPKPNAYVRTVEASADLFVNASLTHSLDKAVLEPMACGTVPVTTNRSFRDMLEPLGLWLATDTEDALAHKVRDVLERPDFDALRAQVRAIVVRDHSLEKLIPKLVAGLSEKM